MDNLKVYVKRGATNYKEKKLISQIEVALQKKLENDPNFLSSFTPAKNFDELKALYGRYCVEDAQVLETLPKNDNDSDNKVTQEVTEEDSRMQEHKNFIKGMEETIEKPTTTSPVVDPFNDAEPIIRDYVQNEQKPSQETGQMQTSFDEPLSDDIAFELPPNDDDSGKNKKSSSSGNNNSGAKKPEDKQPINPQFNEMDKGKKARSTKRFAKIIVEGVCLLAERGCIWWTTKDITEDKLVKYEIEDTMDLQLLLTLEDNQQVTVRNWFSQKVTEANGLFKVNQQDKNDLVDSLYEVMLEKGIAPTPMQELIINSVKTFVLDMGAKAFMLSTQINSVLTQLKTMKAEEKKAQEINNLPDLDNPDVDDILKQEANQTEVLEDKI